MLTALLFTSMLYSEGNEKAVANIGPIKNPKHRVTIHSTIWLCKWSSKSNTSNVIVQPSISANSNVLAVTLVLITAIIQNK